MSRETAPPRPTGPQAGVTMMAALFFIVVTALFGLLAVRFMSMGEVGSGEGYLYTQARFAALAGRELHLLSLDTGNAYGWDGSSPAALTIGRCKVERIFGDRNATGETDVKLFRVRGWCGAEGEAVARVWEATFRAGD